MPNSHEIINELIQLSKEYAPRLLIVTRRELGDKNCLFSIRPIANGIDFVDNITMLVIYKKTYPDSTKDKEFYEYISQQVLLKEADIVSYQFENFIDCDKNDWYNGNAYFLKRRERDADGKWCDLKRIY